MMSESLINVRNDFTILDSNIVYLDSGATSLTPKVVVQALNDYYDKFNANVHRGIHKLSELATEKYESSRKKIADFINSLPEETVITKGTTDSLNILASSLCSSLSSGDEIILSEMEHHSNLVPWQVHAKKHNLVLKFAKVKNNQLDLDHFKSLLSEKTKVVSIVHVSNVLGCINPIKELASLAHSYNAVIVVDGAQAVPHMKIDVKDLDVDFYAFSSHKVLGPTGVGILYGKKELLESLEPFEFGGDMISEVKLDSSSWNELPWKFEAGTPPIAEVIALGAAVDYLNALGMDNVYDYELYLSNYASEKLRQIQGLKLYHPNNGASVFSFTIDGVHAHDIAEILNRDNVAVRAGHLCAMPLVRDVLKVNSVVRASFYVYNTTEDVDKLVNSIKKVKEVFNV